MKNLSAAIIIALAICSLQACNSSIKTSSKADTDSDTVSAVQDTSSTLNLIVDNDDSAFAVQAASGNLEEVLLGKLAITKGRSKKVKNFGAMMVKDHDKANNKLIAIAGDKKITLPTAPDADAQKMIEKLSAKSGNGFDNAYIKIMIDDHTKDVKFFDDESKKIQDPDLKAFAIKTLPVLQNHLDAIDAIHDSMSQ